MTAAAPDPEDLPDGGAGRGNGLTAARFVPLLDVDPRASEALLAALAAVGIAACVRPRPAAEGGGLDRLLVDEESADAARLVAERELRTQASGPDGGGDVRAEDARPGAVRRDVSAEDVDTAWAAIVAGFDTETTDPVPRWPVQEDVSPSSPSPGSVASATTETPNDPPRRRRSDRPDRADRGRRDEGEHYTPPPAPPIGRPSRYTVVSVLVLLMGLALIVAPSVVGLRATTAVFSIGVLLLTGGAAALVVRMQNGPRHGDGPDDGAVV